MLVTLLKSSQLYRLSNVKQGQIIPRFKRHDSLVPNVHETTSCICIWSGELRVLKIILITA